MKNNDLIAQYVRACSILDEKKKKERRKKVENCQHLFIPIRKKEYYGAHNSSDCEVDPAVVECVHCGLTNKFIWLEEQFSVSGVRADVYRRSFVKPHPFENKLFDEKINSVPKEILFAEWEIPTEHIGVLYKVALEINESASFEELLDIMQNLNQLETSVERLKISNVDEAENLKMRYLQNKITR